MEDYLIDRGTLSQFVDELMKKRPLPVDSTEDLNAFKEKQIKALDDHITKSILAGLNDAQSAELNHLLDTEQENPEVFQDFFKNQGIDLEGVIADAAVSFSANYLQGGQNA